MFLNISKKICLVFFPCLLLANPFPEAGFCTNQITGSVSVEAKNCNANNIEVSIYDSLNQVIERVQTDINGVYTLDGHFPCGSYSAKLTANVPECYDYLSGNRGPIFFVISEETQGVHFLFKRQIPTQMQWLILALIFLTILLLTYIFKAFRISQKGHLVEYQFFNLFPIPFHSGIYKFMLFLTSILVMLGFSICILIYHSAFYSDVIGTIIAAPIFAYLLHILYIVGEDQ